MATFAEKALMLGAPEVAIPLEVAKNLAPHAGAVLMVPLIVIAILLIIVGTVVYSTAKKSKTPGVLLLLLGFMLGGGAMTIAIKSEGHHRRR